MISYDISTIYFHYIILFFSSSSSIHIDSWLIPLNSPEMWMETPIIILLPDPPYYIVVVGGKTIQYIPRTKARKNTKIIISIIIINNNPFQSWATFQLLHLVSFYYFFFVSL